jgi:hypothetical protein
MNSLNDILSQKASDLFPEENQTSTDTPITEEKKPNTSLDVTKLKSLIFEAKDKLDNILRLLDGHNLESLKKQFPEVEISAGGERVIEGVFNGEKMIGADGKEYAIPLNYASKSKLVEGDLLKLTITSNGSFVFKQIGPIDRKTLVGELVSLGENQYTVLADNKTYKILTASVTFYKGQPGDEVIIIVPRDGSSQWAAVDNIIKNT